MADRTLTHPDVPLSEGRSGSHPMDFSEEQRQLIRDTFANGASDAEFAVLMEIARARRLNPLLRQIHFVNRWDSEKARTVWAAQVSIDGLRALAERTGLYQGQDEPEFVENPDGTLKLCKVRVWRRDWPRPAVGIAYWNEYVQTVRDKQTGKFRPTAMWSRMPHVMLAKCLPGRAWIETDLGSLQIADIVNRRLPVRVRSIDLATGQESWQPVVNWFRNGSTREWVKLWAPNNTHGNRCIRLTADHPMWTPRGWVKAGELRVGDEVAVASPTLTPTQRGVLFGSLLGDGTLGGRDNRANCPHFTETHADRQVEYLRWKSRALANLRPRLVHGNVRVKGTEHATVRLTTRSAPVLWQYRRLFYPDGVKRLPPDVLDQLGDLGVAVWVMDDGNLKADTRWPSRPRLRLYTCCFDGLAHEQMQVFFKERYGVTASLRRPEKNPYLDFSADDTEALLGHLSRYLTFDREANDKRWCAPEIETGPEASFVFVPLLRVENWTGDELEGRYDIEVEGTHTFFYNNILVSNCAEALAMRKAFPEDMGGLYTPEEMAQATNDPPFVRAQVEARAASRNEVPVRAVLVAPTAGSPIVSPPQPEPPAAPPPATTPPPDAPPRPNATAPAVSAPPVKSDPWLDFYG